jgi:hypothetical protein
MFTSKNRPPCLSHRAISFLYLCLVAKKRSRVLVLFPLAAFTHALSVDTASNTWRAVSSPSRPTTSALALSPKTAPHPRRHSGAAPSPLLVPLLLAALAALCHQSADTAACRARPRSFKAHSGLPSHSPDTYSLLYEPQIEPPDLLSPLFLEFVRPSARTAPRHKLDLDCRAPLSTLALCYSPL